MPEGWEQNFAFNPENVAPNAAFENLDDLLLGVDVNNQDVLYNRPGLMALTFPHLFPFCRGHYDAFCTLTQEHRDIPEEQGGAPVANDVEGTLKSYAKRRLLMRDRRFGKDISFIFFLLDLIEKHNIHSANRCVIHTGQFGPVIRKRDIMDAATRNARQDLVSFIPHTIRSSQQYKQRQALNLQQMFKAFGTPQLFLTFSCDDFNQDFIRACSPTEIPDDNMRLWNDPVSFAAYFKRQWLAVFEQYVRSDAGLGGMVGGIREWSWVMEIQSRGSPHIHFVLWTGHTKEQLMANPNLISTAIPNPFADPDLFGFSKELFPDTHIGPEAQKVVYQRTIYDDRVPNYNNPYLLKLIHANMDDIQINNDENVYFYLAKYLTKMDDIRNMTLNNEPNRIMRQQHFRGRGIDPVEAQAKINVINWSITLGTCLITVQTSSSKRM
ncbi:hypothetical protein G6F42_021956 [Rhizopus arrhizus]|nr:hypothetical protein G6F42_021956 [Rhizopus arrhizus]